jgi:hypothetical protein
VAFVPVAPRVFVGGTPVATLADKDVVAGCPLNVSGSAQTWLRVLWLAGAVRVTSNLLPLVLRTSVGLCLAGDQAPQGPPIVGATQPRVLGT